MSAQLLRLPAEGTCPTYISKLEGILVKHRRELIEFLHC